MLDTALGFYSNLLNIYKTQYDKLSKAKKKRIKVQDVPENLPIDLYLVECDLPPMPVLERNEGVKFEPEETITERIKLNSQKRKNAGTGLKVLTPSKLLTRLSISLAQMKAGNNLYKLKKKKEIKKITKKVYNNLIKSI